MQSFTTEDLLLYMYNETSPETTIAIKNALESDWSLKEKMEELLAANQELESLSLSPREQSIENIMNYAERTVEELTPHA